MGRGAFLKTSFNAGELSPLLDGRSDLEKYPQGCSLLENFIPTVQGPIYHRPGTQFVDNLGGSNPVLVPFVYNRDQSYVLAIGSVIRVYADRGVVESSPGVPYTISGPWSAPPRRADGSSRLSYTQSGDVLFVCDAEGGLPLMAIKRLGHASWTVEEVQFEAPPVGERLDALVHVIDAFPYDPFDFTTALSAPPAGEYYMRPFSIPGLVQGDTGIVFCDLQGSGYLFPKWSSGLSVDPYRIISYEGRYYCNNSSGSITTSSVPPTHESGYGEYDNTTLLYVGTGRFYFEILEWLDISTNPSVPWLVVHVRRIAGFPGDDLGANIFRASDGLSDAFAFSRNAGLGKIRTKSTHTIGRFPDNVAIFRERLWLNSNRDQFASVAGDFYNFRRTDGAGQVVADSGMALTLLAGDLSPVSWMAPSDRLVLGSPGGERTIGEQNVANAFGPTNVKVDVTAATGSVDVGPALVGRDILMLDRTGRRLIRTGLTQDGQGSANLSALADHLGLASPFIAMAWREVPTPVLFLASAAGQLVGCTFEPSQDVASWHRHNEGGLVRDVVAIPSLDGTRDDLWLLVERTILGNQVFYLEVMPDDYRMGLKVEDARYLDSSVSYAGVPADEFTGLGHLEGEQVQAVGDGFVYTGLTVHLGAVTLPQEHSKVTIGKYSSARVRTMRLHLGADDGVNMGKNARLTKASARMVDTVNIRAGGDFVNMNRLDFRDGGQAMDVAVPSQSEERSWSPRGGYSTEAYLCLEQDQPLPATIVSLGLEFEVN